MDNRKVIDKAATQSCIRLFASKSRAYILPFKVGANWAIEYCGDVIKRVLEHYEPHSVLESIMSDFDEIISSETK